MNATLLRETDERERRRIRRGWAPVRETGGEGDQGNGRVSKTKGTGGEETKGTGVWETKGTGV